ncbi:MAG: glycosyltransferase family 1 protein [Anaerolineae bacterium]|nr:MAG: glycosyltransferase family 1 protein [Anaerolineae bacterium]
MRVLLIISEAPPVKSGIARVAEHMLAEFPAYGHEVDVFSYQDVGTWQYRELRLSNAFAYLPTLWQRMQSYDIVHIHGPAPTFSDVLLLGLGAHPRHPRLVYTFHFPIALPGFMVPSRIYNWLNFQFARLADHVTATSPSYAQVLTRYLPPQRVSVVPSGADYARFASKDAKPEGYRILFVGQMRATKGLQVLLRAYQGIEGAHLDVVGSSDAEPRYRKLAQDLGLRNITFHGRVSDEKLAALYRQAHVFVLPAITPGEAFGVVQLEAMAAGCVSIASDLPGVRDVAGDVGYTFPPGDHAALKKLLLYLRDHPEERARRAARGPQWAQRFTWKNTVALYEALYQRLLAGEVVANDLSRFPAPRVLPESVS